MDQGGAVMAAEVGAWVSHAVRLAEDVVLLAGVTQGASHEAEPWLEDESIEASVLTFQRSAQDQQTSGILVGLHMRSSNLEVPLTLFQGEAALVLGPADLEAIETDIMTLVRECLAWLDESTRRRVMKFLVSLTVGRAAHVLSENLSIAREGLRERLPLSVIDAHRSQILHLENVLAVDETSFCIHGWLRDDDARMARLTAVSPEGDHVEIAECLYRYPRHDLAELFNLAYEDVLQRRPGFLTYAELGAPSKAGEGWLVVLRNRDGSGIEALAPPVVRRADVVRGHLLSYLALERPGEDRLKRSVIEPALSRIQKAVQERVRIESIEQYGEPPPAPDVSLVIPLYKRVDLLEQQLAQFVHDQEILAADVIYVLDSPELGDFLHSYAEQLYRLYRVPFRVVFLSHNGGFSVANNAGASVARGRLLLLLNSDILPDRAGWLSAMRDFFDRTPQIGALSPKLLYEDDSLQHAGLFFDRPPGSRLWANEHYFKGLHRHFPPANIARRVPAVTAACLMASLDVYGELGGLRGAYVQGDYEDSDFCLRLAEAGYDCWYLPEVELYHLEGQSYSGSQRELSSQYNMWLHTQLWDDRIQRAMDHEATASPLRRADT
jgi:GT2 family glycosyltransferase